MCIKNGNWFSEIDNMVSTDNDPKFGEIVTILQECDQNPCNWEISEYLYDSTGRRQGYNKKHFAPLSNIDEMELVNELQTINS